MNKGYSSISYNSEKVLENCLSNLAENGIIGYDYAIIKHNNPNPHIHFWISMKVYTDMQALRNYFNEYRFDIDNSFPIGFVLPFHEVSYEKWNELASLSIDR